MFLLLRTATGRIVFFNFIFLILCCKGYSQSDTTTLERPDAAAQTEQQNKVSLKDAKEISYQAQATVEGLQNLLNYITFSDNVPSELTDVIANSYQTSRNRIFYNKDIIIEDDINPQAMFGKTKDVPAEKYLNDLDLQYEKTADATVAFSNINISPVKKKDYVYVKVQFDAKFGSKYKPDGGTYPTRKREALVRLDNVGASKWQALIVGISFYDTSMMAQDSLNNMQVATDTSSSASVISQEEFDKEKQSFILARQEEEKKQQAIFDEYVNLGNTYISNKQYKEAIEIYEKAKELKPLVPVLDKYLIDARRLAAENTFENYKSKGDKARTERKFNEAIQFYRQAISLKPAESGTLQPDIIALTEKLSIVTSPANKLKAGDVQGAIAECEKVLREHKKEKNQYPELYFIQGMAYQKIAEAKPDDRRDLERSLENLNLAIQYFTFYKDARIARADFLVKYKNDLVSAITDYDMLTSNELDDSPDKPLLFVAKAKLKDKLQNTSDALSDYNQAIRLNKNNPTVFFDKGELLYRTKNGADAQKAFDTAINLNPKYTIAYYYRGLNFIRMHIAYQAGLDFSAAEKLGLDSFHLKAVDSISNEYFARGKGFSGKNDFANADSAYNDALRVRNCNADALHGKAEIRLITGKYRESILLNRQAITCNPNFSDAWFKKGLGHGLIREYDSAVLCFTNAVKSDPANVQAFIERGNTNQVLEKYAAAVEDYSQAIILLQTNIGVAKQSSDKALVKSINDDLSKANLLKGQAQYYLANYSDALISLNKAIDLLETNSEALYYKGLVFYAQGELSRSSKALDDAIKIEPASKYYYANGKTNLKNKKYPVSIANFSLAINTDSVNLLKDKYYLRGFCYFKNKQYTEALADFDVYTKSVIAKTDTDFYADYGVAQLIAGQDSLAVKSFNTAITFSSKNAKALFGLACYDAKSGQADKALELFQKAFSLRMLTKEEIKAPEELFLTEFTKLKANRQKYNELKKASFSSN